MWLSAITEHVQLELLESTKLGLVNGVFDLNSFKLKLCLGRCPTERSAMCASSFKEALQLRNTWPSLRAKQEERKKEASCTFLAVAFSSHAGTM